MKEYKINEYIIVKLENGKTNIYVNGKIFRQCKYLAFQLDVNNLSQYDQIRSIDEMEERDRSDEYNKLNISAEDEFWGHCSNLQAWVDNNYNTRILHRNIAFPLLKELSEAGCKEARKVFKEEIVRRYLYEGHNVQEFLEQENYLDYLEKIEMESIIESLNFERLKEENPKGILMFLYHCFRKGSKKAQNLLYNQLELLQREMNTEEILLILLPLDVSVWNTFEKSLKDLLPDYIYSEKPKHNIIWTGLEKGWFSVLSKKDRRKALEILGLPKGEIKALLDLETIASKELRLWSKITLDTQCSFTVENNHVIEIRLNACELKTFPHSIGRLRHLEVLKLEKNQLTEIPDALSQLSALTELSLTHNNISMLSESIGDLSSLKNLYLDNNRIIRLPESITQLESLVTLNLEDNCISTLPDTIGHLTSLKTLELSNNNFIEFPRALGNLHSLEKLTLKKNKLMKLSKSLGELQSLKVLILTDNKLISLPDSIGDLIRLEKLDLRGNYLKSIPESIVDCASLSELKLDDNNISKIPELFGNLHSLRYLSIRRNYLSTLPESIKDLESLATLELGYNNLTSIPESIGNLSRLRNLNLANNKLRNLPQSLGKLTSLHRMQINGNNISTLPTSIKNLQNLKWLDLGNISVPHSLRSAMKDVHISFRST
ncbi:MAG: hypothetical protein R6U96_10125 [Promethearchaeia archaeon]